MPAILNPSTRVEPPARGGTIRSIGFHLVLIWYWALLYLIQPNVPPERFGAMYWLLVTPVLVWLIVELSTRRLPSFTRIAAEPLSSPIIYFMAFAIVVLIVATVKDDYTGAINLFLLAFVFGLIPRFDHRVSTRFINILFGASLVGSVLFFHTGLNPFGYLPGQDATAQFAGLSRVSLFPSIADSALFCVIVIAVNVTDRSGARNSLAVLVAAYFLLFSGNRTAFIAAAILAGFVILRKARIALGTAHYMLFYWGTQAFVAALIIGPLFLPHLVEYIAIDSEFLNSYVLRKTEEGGQPYYHVFGRGEEVFAHLRLLYEYPLIGAHSQALEELEYGDQSRPDRSLGGSLSMLTRVLAAYGIGGVLLTAGFYLLARRAARGRDDRGFSIALMLPAMLTLWGSSFSAYSFLALLCAALLEPRVQRVSCSPFVRTGATLH